MSARSIFGGLSALVAMTGLSAQATVLTFNASPQFGDDNNFNGGPTSSRGDYGDNVTAAQLVSGDSTTNTPGRTYFYGSGGGATPNVSAYFSSTDGDLTNDGNRWYHGYGDLPDGQLYITHSGAVSGSEVDNLTLTAEAGYNVTFDSIDFAADTGTSSLNVLRFYVDNVLAYDAVLANGGASISVPSTGHITFSSAGTGVFGIGNITGSSVRIEMSKDPTSAGPYWNIGYDNVQFSQIPEPTSVALIGLSGLALLRRRP